LSLSDYVAHDCLRPVFMGPSPLSQSL
jgi:hypothetical protein